MKVSAVIITFNEAENIERAITSVRWADEVLVVDSESTDQTVEIAERLGARVIVEPWQGFSKQKQFAVDNAAFDRIFSLDADEVVSEELRREIGSIKTFKDCYPVPRLSIYMGRPIKTSGWYPDRQMRFFDRRKGAWNDVVIHESFKPTGDASVGELQKDILHYSVTSSAQHNKMIAERYAPLSARQMFQNGRRTSPFRVAMAGPSAFIRSYFLKLGFMDGFPGFVIAKFAAHNAFLKHLLLYEMQKRDK